MLDTKQLHRSAAPAKDMGPACTELKPNLRTGLLGRSPISVCI